jgi:hypothetical protein
MQNLRPFLLGALVAFGAVFAIHLVPESQADAGSWTCYVADRFPDMDKAATWGGSIKAAEGLNKVASHTPAGEILVLELPVQKGPSFMGTGGDGAPSVVCVKSFRLVELLTIP